ncbi:MULTISPECIES: hypothetical protein [Paenibacillus]|uniref:Uncharacterized protein n=1 Tax=Paenibacillus pabuli TaxID=1472 RepID=A0A855Y6V1_9BACL|nr:MULTISPECIES: hypothetical protein [Paenibacillus]PWW38778.1 hypothetical protein DET56_107180 [Paenibacillus pabuli]PXW05963.1 hypothetical protein DEU73_107180 [Paenibacillus taichungensis]
MSKRNPPATRLLLLIVILLLTGCQTLQKDQAPKVSISVDELRAFSEKGGKLGWNDFAAYSYQDEGSGLFVRNYSINGGHHLSVIGKSLDQQPDHVYVVHKDGEQIDLLRQNIGNWSIY